MSELPNRRSSVCIATPEFHGLPGSGGIGTAFGGLAETLAAAGHAVTVLHAGEPVPEPVFRALAARMRAQGVDLVALPAGPEPQGCGGPSGLSYRVFRWLAERPFDVVHFADWMGLGYWAGVAKRQGLAFGGATLVIGLHGPSRWVRSAARSSLKGHGELEADLIERGSIEQADAVVSPSAYMLDWVRRAGWQPPADAMVLPNILPAVQAEARASAGPIREIVFFGRLEERKGVSLFCDALDRMASSLGDGVRVTFLGGTAPVDGEDGAAYVRRRSAAWPVPVTLINDFPSAEALAYLAEGGRLAVIPSLGENLPCTVAECIALGVPFLASAVGGTPELVDDRDAARVLFAPTADALAGSLRRALDEGVKPAGPRHAREEIAARWSGWHADRSNRLPQDRPRPAIARDPSQAGEYVLVAEAGVAVADEALARFVAPAAGATGAVVLAGALETEESLRLAPTASTALAMVRDIVGPGPLIVRRDRLAGMPQPSEGSAARQEWLARLLFDGERIETIPFALGRTDGSWAAHPPLSPADRLAAFRSAAPAAVGDLAGLTAVFAEQAQRAEADRLRLAAECGDAIRERNGFALELECVAMEAHAQNAFWRARLAGLLASWSWRVTEELRLRFGGVGRQALAAMPPERAVDMVLGSVWWDVAAPVRLAVRALRRLSGRRKAAKPVTNTRSLPGSTAQ